MTPAASVRPPRFLRLDGWLAFSPEVARHCDTVPTAMGPLLWGERRAAGLAGLLGLAGRALARRVDAEIDQLATENLARRRIAVPRLFDSSLVGALYRRSVLLRCLLLLGALERRTRAARPDACLVFNGSLVPESVLVLHARRHRLPTLFFERGFFPGTMQIDAAGINGNSAIPREPAFYRANADRFGPQELPRRLNRRRPKRRQVDTSGEALPARYIFVPFQVPSDMQIRQLSPWVPDMRAFHMLLERLAGTDPDIRFVVKEHPSFRWSLRGEVRPHPRIRFFNDRETAELIEGARAVLTINSTVGIEALLFGKPVIVLGIASYAVDGLVLKAPDFEALRAAVARLDTWQPDEGLRTAFLRYVCHCYLVPGKHADLAVTDLLTRLKGAPLRQPPSG